MRLHHRVEAGPGDAAHLRPRPWERGAVVDVRPSTRPPVLEPQASTRRPSGLVRRAGAWGGPEARELVSAEALGRSGTRAEGRHGWQRRVAAVARDHGGVMRGVERSRVARAATAWHPWLALGALGGTRSAARDGIEARSPDTDRVVWGCNGTMRAAARPLLPPRLEQGPLPPARRGARRVALPLGDVHHAVGAVG